MSVEVNWKEMYVMAEKTAWTFTRDRNRMKELKSVAVIHLFYVHNQFDSSRGVKFSTWAYTVMKYAMLKQLRVWKGWETRVEFYDSFESDLQQDGEIADQLCWKLAREDEQIKHFEETFDFDVNTREFLKMLTPSESRLTAAIILYSGAGSKDIAALADFPSSGAVRIHMNNVRKKYNSFQNKDINKMTSWKTTISRKVMGALHQKHLIK
jgi:DNA-directed RNA polymerase specialized sigma24 family protein